MKRRMLECVGAMLLLATSISLGWAGETGSTVTATPEWDKVKSLVGEWDGYVMEGGKKMEGHVSVRMTGDGSALMHWMDAGTPHEMITMFHMDKNELLGTHYCAAHNQPRFRAVPSKDPSKVVFEFKDGTNIRPGDGFMRQLTITFVDAEHHNETWGYDSEGKVSSATFFMTRSKKPAAK
jgi:YD repeat-containing protein